MYCKKKNLASICFTKNLNILVSHQTCEEVNFIVLCCPLKCCALIFFYQNSEYDLGPYHEVHTSNIADSIMYTLRYGKERLLSLRVSTILFDHKKVLQNYACLKTFQRKYCTPWECALFSLRVQNSVESMFVLKTVQENITHLEGVKCFS